MQSGEKWRLDKWNQRHDVYKTAHSFHSIFKAFSVENTNHPSSRTNILSVSIFSFQPDSRHLMSGDDEVTVKSAGLFIHNQIKYRDCVSSTVGTEQQMAQQYTQPSSVICAHQISVLAKPDRMTVSSLQVLTSAVQAFLFNSMKGSVRIAWTVSIWFVFYLFQQTVSKALAKFNM